MNNAYKTALTRKRKNKAARHIQKAVRANQTIKKTKLGSAAAKRDYYIVKINLTTDRTGRKKLNFIPTLLENRPEKGQPWVPIKHENEFRIKRVPGRSPYEKKPKRGLTPEWDTLETNIKNLLNSIFPKNRNIRLPNPLYPHDRKRDLIFHINYHAWLTKPHSPSRGDYKFVINIDKNNNLIVNINVKLNGHFIKDKHSLPSPTYAVTAAPSSWHEKMKMRCNYHLHRVRDLVKSYKDSKKFEKSVKRAEKEAEILGKKSVSPWKGGRRRKTKRRTRRRRKQKKRIRRQTRRQTCRQTHRKGKTRGS